MSSRRAGFLGPSYRRGAVTLRSTISASTQVNRFPFGGRRAGFTRTIRAAGFSGIADIISAADCRKRICTKSGGGKLCAATLHKSVIIASRAIGGADHASGKHFFNGPTTAVSCSALPKPLWPQCMSTLGQPRQFERATDTSAWGLPSDVLLLRSEPALSANSRPVSIHQ